MCYTGRAESVLCAQHPHHLNTFQEKSSADCKETPQLALELAQKRFNIWPCLFICPHVAILTPVNCIKPQTYDAINNELMVLVVYNNEMLMYRQLL